MSQHFTAACACGQASITLLGPPHMHGVCHCTNCKRRTGSAFGISAYFKKSAVLHRTGETVPYAFHHAEQNHDQERHFCKRCGTTLFWYISSMPEDIGVAGGCFAEGSFPAPSYSTSESKRWNWVTLPTDWPRYGGK